MSKEQILQEVLTLSEKEREYVAEKLLLSVDHSSREEIEALWKTEADKRLEETLQGKRQTFDGREVINSLRSPRI